MPPVVKKSRKASKVADEPEGELCFETFEGDLRFTFLPARDLRSAPPPAGIDLTTGPEVHI